MNIALLCFEKKKSESLGRLLLIFRIKSKWSLGLEINITNSRANRFLLSIYYKV